MGRKTKQTMNGLERHVINPWKRDIWGIYGGLWNGLWVCNKRFGRVRYWLQMLKPFFRFLKHLFFLQCTGATNDAQRRIMLIDEINTLLTKSSKKKRHLLPAVVLQLIKLRFPEDLDSDNPSTFRYDVSLVQFVK